MLAAYILRSEEMQNTTNDQIRNENTKFIIKTPIYSMDILVSVSISFLLLFYFLYVHQMIEFDQR